MDFVTSTYSRFYLQVSDGLIIVENDHMQQICSQLLGLKHVSFEHINKVIAHEMSHLLAPATSFSASHNHLGRYYVDCGYQCNSVYASIASM